MARFLSAEWLDELAMAMDNVTDRTGADGAAGSLGIKTGLTVRQVVTGSPDGDTSFVIRSGDGSAILDRRPDQEVDVEIRQDFATAVAIATGKLSPSAAFAAGRIKLTGRVGLLVEQQDALASLGDPFTTLRLTTSY